MGQNYGTAMEQELVIGLVAPIGTDLDAVCSAVHESLKRVNYSSAIIRLSELLDTLKKPKTGDWPKRKQTPLVDRYNSYMDAGNAFRHLMNRGDALALMAVGAIRETRAKFLAAPEVERTRRAYILKSLKHPHEVAALRRIYGPAFVLISACSPPAKRIQLLAEKIADSQHVFQTRQVLAEAQKLVLRDEAEKEGPFGQNVRKAFPLGDFFLNARSPAQLRDSTQRVIELLFGNPFHTPTRDEYGLFLAQGAALRSASLQRQVGAVIATADGGIIAVGANEVPKPGGGLYWSDDSPDHRDFRLGYETNDRLKSRMLADVINRLKKSNSLARRYQRQEVAEILGSLGEQSIFSDAQIMNVIEFGRCVHAEMAAIVDAARRGASVNGSTIYSTTFPCHECARHIVAAGVKRVVFIEPYPKSLVNELYPDSIEVDAAEVRDSHVHFEPFVGVAPRRYLDLFAVGDIGRKDKTGKIAEWYGALESPRLGEYSFRTWIINNTTERDEFAQFADGLAANGFVASDRARSQNAKIGRRVVSRKLKE